MLKILSLVAKDQGKFFWLNRKGSLIASTVNNLQFSTGWMYGSAEFIAILLIHSFRIVEVRECNKYLTQVFISFFCLSISWWQSQLNTEANVLVKILAQIIASAGKLVTGGDQSTVKRSYRIFLLTLLAHAFIVLIGQCYI